jgi:hypothetical protein
MPAVGAVVTLRMLSAPEPREQSLRSGSIDQGNRVLRPDVADCKFARVVTCE